MRSVRVVIDGETYLPLAALAECYECRLEWMIEVYETGLLGRGRVVGGQVLISTCLLDRVAEVVRLNLYHGVGLAVLALLLEPDLERDEL